MGEPRGARILATFLSPAKIVIFMPTPRNDVLALTRFVLSSTRATNGRSLDQQWDDLARFMKGPGSALARWLAIGQMHSLYRQMKLGRGKDLHRPQIQPIGDFIERACKATGLSTQSIYNYVDRSRSLVEVLGPPILKAMLSGNERIVNDENLLIKVGQLPAVKALKIVQMYMRGGKSEGTAARLVESASTSTDSPS